MNQSHETAQQEPFGKLSEDDQDILVSEHRGKEPTMPFELLNANGCCSDTETLPDNRSAT
jgi:hypothetical protein